MKKEIFICDICQKNMDTTETRSIIDFKIHNEDHEKISRSVSKHWEVCLGCRKSEFGIENSTIENGLKFKFGFRNFYKLFKGLKA